VEKIVEGLINKKSSIITSDKGAENSEKTETEKTKT
jgi:hypothetical protein